MNAIIGKFAVGWSRFFFSPQPLFPVSVFRILFGLNLVVMYLLRAMDWRFYFTDAGFVPGEQALEILPEFFRPSLALYPASPAQALALNLVLLASALFLTIGYKARAAAIVAFVAHTSLMQRNYAIVYGADIVSTFFLFSLCFCESDRYLSLRAFLAGGRLRAVPGEISGLFSQVGLRLLQIQVCVIYGYTGLEKLKGPSWWDGSAVWAVLGNSQIMLFDTNWLKHVPLMIVAMTFSTVLWEVYFPVLVWIKPLRPWVLAFGAVLHVMIALSVGLIFFSTAMMSTYVAFLDAEVMRARFSRFVPAKILG